MGWHSMTKVMRADGGYLHSPGSGMSIQSSWSVVRQGHYDLAVRSSASIPSAIAALPRFLTSYTFSCLEVRLPPVTGRARP